TETQGLVIGEAKAVGLPVVAIRAFGPAEMVAHGEDGLLTDPSITAFAEAIITLLSDRDLYEAMSAKALENVNSISSAYCAEQMLAVYRELLDRGASAPRRRFSFNGRFLNNKNGSASSMFYRYADRYRLLH
ncbi:MAG TPA: glycosyltransferase, partial [Firmicutes bacterium]|nr:glycosyltransferase [Bacillota bacterium]